jgi:hypothetical protein
VSVPSGLWAVILLYNKRRFFQSLQTDQPIPSIMEFHGKPPQLNLDLLGNRVPAALGGWALHDPRCIQGPPLGPPEQRA